MWTVAEAGEAVFAATGIGYNLSQRVPCIVRRRQAAATRFVTVYDWSGSGRTLRAPAGDPAHVEFDTAVTQWHIGFTSDSVRVQQELIK